MIMVNSGAFEVFPTLDTQRLRLVKPSSEHAETIYAIRTDQKVMRYMDTAMPSDINDIKSKFCEMDRDFESQKGFNWIIIDKTNPKVVIGFCSIWKIDHKNHRGEIGYTLESGHWGCGYAEEAVSAVLDFGFTSLGLHSVCANVNPDNARSIRLLQKLTFNLEATFREDYYFNGRFLDSHIYAILDRDWKTRRSQV